MWRPWTGEKKPVRPHGTQDIYYLIHIPIRFVDDEEENRDLAERKRGRTHVLASSLMTAGLSQPPFCCCCRTCCCIMASAPAFSSANRTLTLAECLRNFSQHLVTHCEEEGRTGPGTQSQCPSHSQRRSSLSLSLTLSSLLSRFFLRNESTQSLKHFSTSLLYIRKLYSQGNGVLDLVSKQRSDVVVDFVFSWIRKKNCIDARHRLSGLMLRPSTQAPHHPTAASSLVPTCPSSAYYRSC